MFSVDLINMLLFMKQNKILLLGGTGFIGQNLLKVLQKYDVLIPTRKNILNKKGANYVYYDSYDYLKEELIKHEFSFIINCSNSYNSELFMLKNTFESNVIFPLEIILHKKIKFDFVINIGTILPFNTNIYSLTKKNLEEYLNLFLDKKKFININAGSIYGCGMSKKSLIYKVCISKNQFTLKNGNDYRTFLFVEDFQKAILKILDNINNLCIYENIVIRSNRLIKLSDFALNFNLLYKRKIKIEYNSSFSEAEYYQNSLQDLSGWEESYSLEEGLIKFRSSYR